MPSSGQEIVILVVDDEVIVRNIVQRILTKEGVARVGCGPMVRKP